MTVEQLRNEMSVEEFHSWIVYKRIESKRIQDSQKSNKQENEDWD